MLPKRTRLKTFDYVGAHRYFLTFCTSHRANVFTSTAVVDLVLEQFARAADQHRFAIVAYCFMPDHVHTLVEGKEENSDLQQFAKAAKQLAGYYYKQRTGRALWQPSYHEHVLRNEDDVWRVLRYIVENPIVAGLAQRADEYPFLGSCVMEKQELLLVGGQAQRGLRAW